LVTARTGEALMLLQTAQEYQRNAAEVRSQAELMDAGCERDGLLKLADHWKRLARLAEQQQAPDGRDGAQEN
jgi:hypothetical protein